METFLPKLPAAARPWLRLIALLAAAALLCWMGYAARAAFTTPLLLALALAYILNPLVTWFERRWGAPRLLTVGIVFVLVIALLVVGGFYVGSRIVAQVGQFQESFGRYVDLFAHWTRVHAAAAAGTEPTTERVDWWATAGPLLKQHGAAIAGTVSGYVTDTLGSVLNLASLLVLVPLFTLVLLWRFNDLVGAVRDHLPAATRATIVHVVATTDRAIAGFFRGRLIVCLLIGLLSALGWSLVGVPYALLLGLLTGLLSLVPFLSLLALPPALLLAYAGAVDAGRPWPGPVTLAMVVYVAVQTLDSFVLSPYILGRSSGLHPVTTLAVLLIGGQVAGLLGMLLAIPVASTLKTLAAEFVLPEIRRLAGRPADDAAPQPHTPR